MQEVILVPIGQDDSMDQIVPFIDRIARGGMRVSFLVRSRASGWDRLNAHLTVIHTGNVIALQTCGARESSRLEHEKHSAEAKLEAVTETLRRKGLDTSVEVYTGNLKKTLAKLAKASNVRFVMMPASDGNFLARVVGSIGRFVNPVRRTGFSPLVLVHPEIETVRSK